MQARGENKLEIASRLHFGECVKERGASETIAFAMRSVLCILRISEFDRHRFVRIYCNTFSPEQIDFPHSHFFTERVYRFAVLLLFIFFTSTVYD